MRLQYHARVQRHDFAYDLPSELIAQTPLAERSASRLLVLEPAAATVARHDDTDHAPTGHDGDRYDDTDDGSDRRETISREAAGRESAGHETTHGKTAHPESLCRDRTMRDFPNLLRPGDLLVFNDTKVVAARLLGTKPSGGRVEIFLERAVADDEALVQLRASKPIREGLEVTTAGGVVRVIGREDDLWRVAFPGSALEFFERWGEVPLPPYIHRTADSSDRERYQSIFARERGAVAAPTASLHFDDALIREIEARGVSRAFVTLHVGAGTFQPLRTDDLESHVMHAERVSVSPETCQAIERTRAAGGRVIAIGTTVVRALESAALAWTAGAAQGAAQMMTERETASETRRDPTATHGALATPPHAAPSTPKHGAPRQPPVLPEATGWSGDTRLFIRPGFTFQVTDALLTNFHLPESTLLMLVCAFAGKDSVLTAYQHAVRARYRFFSYGDAMFLTNANVSANAKGDPSPNANAAAKGHAGLNAKADADSGANPNASADTSTPPHPGTPV